MVQPSCAGVHSTTRAGTFTMWTYSGGIYQFNLQLFACSTHSANWWPPSSQHLWYHHSLPPLLKSTIALKRESQRPALPLHSYTISSTVSEERGALASKHCFKFRGKSSLVIAQSKGCTHRSELDRQTRVRPQKTHPFPPAHTGTAPGSVPHTMQMGSDPIPSGKAKEASSEISGVSKSWAHTQKHPWRFCPQPRGTWHEYSVLRNSDCDWFRYRGLNFLVKSHWVHSQHAPITSRCVYFCFLFKKTN